jgi:hypothetical protein
MFTDISFISLSSCWTADIGAKYLSEVHGALLFVVVTKKFAPEPLFFQICLFITLLCTPTIGRHNTGFCQLAIFKGVHYPVTDDNENENMGNAPIALSHSRLFS